MKTKTLYILICILLFVAFVLIMLSAFSNITQQTNESISEYKPTVIIDAGHGGEDGGAVVGDNIEKDLNLSIALKLSDILKLNGFDVKNIRETDVAIYTDDAQSLSQKKKSDLNERLKIFNSDENNIVISIHQNKFEQSQYFGTQIFYSKNNENSATLAESIRKSVVMLLQPDNTRECKPAGKNIFLLDNATVPAVIVECGFMSNENELNKLKDENYQNQMAFAIYLGFLEYYNSLEG